MRRCHDVMTNSCGACLPPSRCYQTAMGELPMLYHPLTQGQPTSQHLFCFLLCHCTRLTTPRQAFMTYTLP
ncbi:hypothetical protein Pmani_001379 [Petrolisthes manimaculis]|uniref:Uncharacterized protein n=1 Tax=Petrolisthes manimaculis TaxID=1843537 RepID=A0AAE1QK84_9EUCA|nr:hypothetical protein Pmani_001379 [Petrolisthes manimaculis]